MRVLVLGQGGREHALAWRLQRSPSVSAVFCAPGNPGTAAVATNWAIPEDDPVQLLRACRKHHIDLAVIGPEAPLVAGLADKLRAGGVLVFGPSAEAARLEGSKIFCKEILRHAKAPTAEHRIFQRLEDVDEYLHDMPQGFVVKADGLCAGKGVVVCSTPEEVFAAAKRMLEDHEFGRAGERILLEDLLTGPEVSVLALTDGTALAILPPAHDYKRAFDLDAGPNTGGMGCVCPSPRFDAAAQARVERDILVPTLHTLRHHRIPYQGVLYAGLMMTPHGPKALEYNVRFGDPECQPLMMRLRSDLGVALRAVAEGKLKDLALEWDPRPAVCVVAASGGYPGPFRKDLPIRGLDAFPAGSDVALFHGATQRDGDRIVTAGGRVFSVCALGDTIDDARAKAYDALARVSFTGMHFRKDIGLS